MDMRNLFILSLFIVSMGNAQTVKVMTYNLRYANTTDGINAWDNRKEKVYTLLKKYDPDIIGAQEAMHVQLKDLYANVPGYEWIGVGREDGKEKGEFSAILYRQSKFDLIEHKTFWLSETPEVAGSKNWDAALTRTVTWARFKDKKSGKTFQFFNTHFDHVGKEARKNSSALIQKWIQELGKKYKEEAIVTGDFNVEKTDEPYAVMMAPGNLNDTRPASDTRGTFCGFGVNAMTCRGIDYIFTTKKWKSSDFQIIQDNDGANYPSDHLPVMVTLKK